MTVEIRATMIDGEGTVWCSEAEADQFSVYLGEVGDFEWVADFRGYSDARNWATEVAECHNCELVDYVEEERGNLQTS